MNIGLSTSVIQRGQTGIAQYVTSLVRALESFAREHPLHLFTLQEDLPLFAFADHYVRHIVVPERFRPAVKNVFWHQTVLPRLLKQHKIDVLHVPSYRRLLATAPCARVATIHDLAPYRVAHKYDLARTLYAKVVAKYLCRFQDEIIVISHLTARDVSDFFHVPQQRLHVVYNGIDHGRFCEGPVDRARLWANQRFGLKAPFFLYVARLEHPAKNHIRLIEAFLRFRASTGANCQLALAGSDWSGSSTIHQFVAHCTASSQIRFLGFVDDDDLPTLYRAAFLLAYPSLYEGFGLPALEAMACGCPVVASNRGALPEVLGAAAKLVDPESVDQITAALVCLWSDPSVREHLRCRGLEQARRYDWNRTAAATLEVYKRVYQRTGSKIPLDSPPS